MTEKNKLLHMLDQAIELVRKEPGYVAPFAFHLTHLEAMRAALTTPSASAQPAEPVCRTCYGRGTVNRWERVGESDFNEWEDDCPVCGGAGHAPEHVQKLHDQLIATRQDLHNVQMRIAAANLRALIQPKDAAELVELLRAAMPEYGAPGTRDQDVTEQRRRISLAIAALTPNVGQLPPPEYAAGFADGQAEAAGATVPAKYKHLWRQASDGLHKHHARAIALGFDGIGDAIESAAERAEWFSLVMGAAASLEDAANHCGTVESEQAALGAAKHYREQAQALYDAAPPQAAPVAPSFDCSLAAVDAHDPQSFIDGAKWAQQRLTAPSASAQQAVLIGYANENAIKEFVGRSTGHRAGETFTIAYDRAHTWQMPIYAYAAPAPSASPEPYNAYQRDWEKVVRWVKFQSETFPELASMSPEGAISWLVVELAARHEKFAEPSVSPAKKTRVEGYHERRGATNPVKQS